VLVGTGAILGSGPVLYVPATQATFYLFEIMDLAPPDTMQSVS